MKLIDFLLIAIIAAALITALIFTIRNKKNGKNCSCGCGGCNQRSKCNKK